MWTAFGWGLLAGSSLLIGGLITLARKVEARPLGLVMAFGAGVLISAVAYELVLDAQDAAHSVNWIAAGLFTGALAFFAGDLWVTRRGGEHRKRVGGDPMQGVGGALVVGIVLDGIPESVVIGISLIGGAGVSAAMIVAVFLSNLPEAIAATSSLEDAGVPARSQLHLWVGLMLMTAAAAGAGYALLDGASPTTIAFVQSFAAGAILTMLADTMMPEAFKEAGPTGGLATTVGFALSFAIVAIERAG